MCKYNLQNSGVKCRYTVGIYNVGLYCKYTVQVCSASVQCRYTSYAWLRVFVQRQNHYV